MREFFRGWRRKNGLATLLLACLLTVCWIRSQYKFEMMRICGDQSLYAISSFHGDLGLVVTRTRSAGIPVFNWNSIEIKALDASRRQKRSGKLEPFTPSENLDVDWQSKVAGFRFGVGATTNPPRNQAEFYVVPYLLIILPLTFLSAYLLLIKQRPRGHVVRIFAILAASILLLVGCDTNSHKTAPRPLAKNAAFALYVVSATSGANTKTDTDAESGAAIYLTLPAVITSTDVASVRLVEETPSDPSLPGSISLNVSLTPTGATKLSTATATPIGMRLAIVINDKVVASPMLHSALSNNINFSSNKSEAMFDLLTRD